PLPDRGFALAIDRNFQSAFAEIADEHRFECAPARGVIGIGLGKFPDGVQMIWQDCDGNRSHWVLIKHRRIGATKAIDRIDEKPGRPILQCDRKEVRRTRNAIAAVVNHRRSVLLSAGSCDQLKTSSSVGQRLKATSRSPDFASLHPGYLINRTSNSRN